MALFWFELSVIDNPPFASRDARSVTSSLKSLISGGMLGVGPEALAALSIPFIFSTHKRITRSRLQPEESSNKIVSREILESIWRTKSSPRKGE